VVVEMVVSCRGGTRSLSIVKNLDVVASPVLDVPHPTQIEGS
jgi:hypothetical protein